MGKFIDLTGRRFGRLTVLEKDDERTKDGNTYWKCKCQCGNIKSVLVGNLTSGKTKSCGCLAKETTSLVKRKRNKYDLSCQFGIGYMYNNAEPFYFDLEDYEIIKNYNWYFDGRYAKTSMSNGCKIYLHRLIMQVSDSNIQIDHINHNKLDNRKNNLRIASPSQNNMNHKLFKNNTSGTSGVSYDRRTNTWHAYISKDYQVINLGRYEDIEDAIMARKNGEDQYFQEFAYQNSIGVPNEYN